MKLYAPSALLPDGWAGNVTITVTPSGDIESVIEGAEPADAERLAGPVLPGMPNLHSHAFQRALAGLAERRDAQRDDFWGWRELMYQLVARISPDEMQALAEQVYVEMLKAGYTAVGEFHYLHHDRSGEPFGNLAEMSERVVGAATTAGIAITHLPVLYVHSGFGDLAPESRQQRFVNEPAQYAKLLRHLTERYRNDPEVRIGIAPHSLRAVGRESLDAALSAINELDDRAPIHIHIAEQTKEVEDCLAWSGARPVDWLFDHYPVDDRWCLVHATHMSKAETVRLAASNAVAGLCPTTEANLGDGFFPAVLYLERGGHFGIGSDSNTSVSPSEELRTLEYGQRLRRRRRAVLTDRDSVGASLYRRAVAGGTQALGRRCGALAAGRRADLVVLDSSNPVLAGDADDRLLDTLIFSGNVNPVRDVMVSGQWRIVAGRHADEERIAERFRTVRKTLLP